MGNHQHLNSVRKNNAGNNNAGKKIFGVALIVCGGMVVLCGGGLWFWWWRGREDGRGEMGGGREPTDRLVDKVVDHVAQTFGIEREGGWRWAKQVISDNLSRGLVLYKDSITSPPTSDEVNEIMENQSDAYDVVIDFLLTIQEKYVDMHLVLCELTPAVQAKAEAKDLYTLLELHAIRAECGGLFELRAIPTECGSLLFERKPVRVPHRTAESAKEELLRTWHEMLDAIRKKNNDPMLARFAKQAVDMYDAPNVTWARAFAEAHVKSVMKCLKRV